MLTRSSLIRYTSLFDYYNNPVHQQFIYEELARDGDLRGLQFCVQVIGYKWNENTTIAAAAGGHLNCLKFAHENGCPWDERVTKQATKYGHLNCLKYAHENGCPLSNEIVRVAHKYKQSHCLEYATNNKFSYNWTDLITYFDEDGNEL